MSWTTEEEEFARKSVAGGLTSTEAYLMAAMSRIKRLETVLSDAKTTIMVTLAHMSPDQPSIRTALTEALAELNAALGPK